MRLPNRLLATKVPLSLDDMKEATLVIEKSKVAADGIKFTMLVPLDCPIERMEHKLTLMVSFASIDLGVYYSGDPNERTYYAQWRDLMFLLK